AGKTASGQTTIQVPPGTVVIARVSVSDAAGNTAETTSRLMSQSGNPTVAAAVPTQSQTGMSINALGPSPFQSTAPPVQSGGIASGHGLAVPAISGQSSATLPAYGQPPNPQVANYSAAQVPPAMPGMGIPQAPQQHSGSFNGMQNFGGPGVTPTPAVPGSQPFPASAIPVSSSTGGLLVNNRVFDLAYQLQDVGPSGVGSVELFLTEDGGQQWFRYGVDSDLKSPFRVDVQGEGTFGFTIRVRNGVGFSAPPPQPGEVPEIVVTVDHTAPLIEFAQPVLQADGTASVHLAWRVADSNPAQNPVRLEFGTSPAGPWTPVFDWQPDPGGYIWSVNAATPPSLYFRVLARDAAGNVSSQQSTTPLLIDLKRPVARLLNVQVPNQMHNASY
ncbi:MAG: hypothetical protein KDA96_09565, partial [Planctomycetaceae bacterium]|nr:hypothetical protein [Planctomycetaceae bacterium]